MRGLEFRIPLRAATSQNMRFANPFARAAIVKRERKATAQAFTAAEGSKAVGEILVDDRVLVKLVRIGPNELDEDNLAGCMKPVRDELAELLGLESDRDRRVRFVCDQRSEGHVTYRDPKSGKKKRTGVFAVEVMVRRQTCPDCFVEHCGCLHDERYCADCEAAG